MWTNKSNMKNIKILHDLSDLTDGTHKVGGLVGVKYDDLLELLGEPTYFPEHSGDGKVQFEWVLFYDNQVFTIYDWKTYSEEYTKNELDVWSVGGNSDPRWLIDELYASLTRND